MNSAPDVDKQKLMAEAARFRDSVEKRSFWSLIISTVISALAIVFFNFVL
ncbi:hypothetical protein HMPREF9690_05293 [Raoultella ornithinolytica 10-5246]|nr:hypothetical protein HMPREF9690_05293 [Raoultella ornithinolytica 10-5246]